MSDRPIIFSAPMVRALLDGRKSQTRRVIASMMSWHALEDLQDATSAPDLARYQRYQVGDRLWVREKIAYRHQPPADKSRTERWYKPHYCADGEPTSYGVSDIKPAMFMPRWASRLTLIVTDVRVQRLHQISEADAIAEGIEYDRETNGYWGAEGQGVGGATRQYVFAKSAFMDIWDSLNAARGYGWEANPWVVAVTFRTIKANIDSLREAA